MVVDSKLVQLPTLSNQCIEPSLQSMRNRMVTNTELGVGMRPLTCQHVVGVPRRVQSSLLVR